MPRLSPPRPLDIDRIRQATRHLTVGCELRYYPEVDSTNRCARELLTGHWTDGTAVLTEFQKAGRGRSGRSWQAPPGAGLLLSVLLRPPNDESMAHIPMLAGLAITDAVIDVTRLPVSLKWPNDVLCRDHKVCGILTESATGCVILGIGINVNLDPTEYGFPETATTLEKELGRAVSREDLAVALFKRLDIWYRSLTQGPSLVYGAWAARLSTVGSRVQVVDRQGTWQGVATGVRRDGGLIVRRADGQVDTVYAADVSIRRTQDFTSQ